MYCKFCGKLTQGNSEICNECLNASSREPTQVPPQAQDTFIRSNMNYSDIGQPSKNKTVPLSLYIVLGVLAAVLVILTVLLIARPSKNESIPADQENSNGFLLAHEYISSQTDQEYVVLTGTITNREGSANLTLNGELIDTVVAADGVKSWSKTVTLSPGKNSFMLTLSDSSGKSQSEAFSIERLIPLVYQPGTVFVKNDKSAIYIRPTPFISDKYVMMVPANDYTSQFICVGEEFTDSSGYIWCKVKTPASGVGWVRTDLIKAV